MAVPKRRVLIELAVCPCDAFKPASRKRDPTEVVTGYGARKGESGDFWSTHGQQQTCPVLVSAACRPKALYSNQGNNRSQPAAFVGRNSGVPVDGGQVSTNVSKSSYRFIFGVPPLHQVYNCRSNILSGSSVKFCFCHEATNLVAIPIDQLSSDQDDASLLLFKAPDVIRSGFFK
jgi:hypothetical protein